MINSSWDDGPIEDIRLAELLNKYEMPGMFFIPAANQQRPVCSPKQIRELSSMSEIGSHTLNHIDLASVELNEALQEIRSGRAYLEQIIQHPIEHFAYPFGSFTADIREQAPSIVKSARLANIMSIHEPLDFHINASLHIRYRRKKNLVKEALTHAPMACKFSLLPTLLKSYKLIDVIKLFVDYIMKQPNGTFYLHVWGHSWELEQFLLWQELEEILIYLRDYKEFFMPYSTMIAGDRHV